MKRVVKVGPHLGSQRDRLAVRKPVRLIIDRSAMFREAWADARSIPVMTAREAFPMALRRAWVTARARALVEDTIRAAKAASSGSDWFMSNPTRAAAVAARRRRLGSLSRAAW